MTCKFCDWNDDGLCDRLGYLVSDDDKCKIKSEEVEEDE